jgi:uncharacterized membrane protein
MRDQLEERTSANPRQAGVPAPAPGADDRDALVRHAEVIISRVLRGGVLLSAAIILLGVLLFYVRALSSTGGFVDRPYPSSLAAVGAGLMRGDPLAVVALGLLALLATPVVRVAVSIVAFALEHDRRYIVITSLVLVILLISFFLGKGGA